MASQSREWLGRGIQPTCQHWNEGQRNLALAYSAKPLQTLPHELRPEAISGCPLLGQCYERQVMRQPVYVTPLNKPPQDEAPLQGEDACGTDAGNAPAIGNGSAGHRSSLWESVREIQAEAEAETGRQGGRAAGTQTSQCSGGDVHGAREDPTRAVGTQKEGELFAKWKKRETGK